MSELKLEYTITETEPLQPFLNEFDNGFIRMPLAVIDDLMPTLSANEFRVFLLILRKTWGWRKESDRISYKQIHKGANIKGHKTIQKALKGLIDRGLIVQEKGSVHTASLYTINREVQIQSGKNSHPRVGKIPPYNRY